jgi:hypothetical protein
MVQEVCLNASITVLLGAICVTASPVCCKALGDRGGEAVGDLVMSFSFQNERKEQQ